MTTQEILTLLQSGIHSVVCATADSGGLPHTCAVDLMLADDSGLYFLTAKGKSLYERLTAQPCVSLTGMRGKDTLSSIAVTVRGAVKNVGRQRLEEIFAQNPYMTQIYPTEKSREALEVFCLYKGEGEYFDLSQLPPYRQSFAFGGGTVHAAGYRIDPEKCIGCQSCRCVCPQGCISSAIPRAIDKSHCLHCGSCFRVCPVKAVEKAEENE